MGKLIVILGVGLTVISSVYLYEIFKDSEPPVIPDTFWGPKSKENAKEDTSIRPFKINVDEKILADLKARLKHEASPEGSRLTPPLEGIGFQYGFNTDFLKTIQAHWLNKYDWKAREKALNKYPQFKTTIAGIEIHFQHVKYMGPKKYKITRPLLLLHGWPGSFVEFQKVIPLLTEPKDLDINFELIIPSLPGYGFSERAHKPGLSPTHIGQLFLKLMKRLGHDKFYVQGGDWGALIAIDMALMYPKNVAGLHANICVTLHTRAHIRTLIASIYPTLFMDEDDANKIFPQTKYLSDFMEEMGYTHLQATKPDTLGVGLSNSPSGLLAFILEKFSSWTHSKEHRETKMNGELVPHWDLDDLLDNIMVYWVTNSITSSVRLYSEYFNKAHYGLGLDNAPVKVPTACLATPNEILQQSEWIIQDKFPQLVQYNKAEKGGHFAAFEVPDILARDVIKFGNKVESSEQNIFNPQKTVKV